MIDAVVEPAERFPDDPEVLPAGSVVDGTTATRDVEDEADHVVVGTGAAGAAAAVVLAEAGHSVLLLEEGPWVRTRDFGTELLPALKRMFRHAGTGLVTGRAYLPVLQGRCVGGSTTVNSAIAWRLPEHVLHEWARDHGLGEVLSPRVLEPHFEALERDLNVHAVTGRALGNNAGLFERGAAALGIAAERIRRYEMGCEGTASCLTGCRHGRKLGMNVSYVPRALCAGARLYTNARVERVDFLGGRAVGVRAVCGGPARAALRVRARKGVWLAASTIQTPNLLRRSGLRSRHLGEHFQAHPGVSIAGRFDATVTMDVGATQGINSLHFARSERFKLESLALPPELAAARLPGFGAELMERLADYGHLVLWAVVLRAEAEGSVREGLAVERVRYDLGARDMARARKGLRVLSEMMFAAGAREIYPGVHGMPAVLTGPDQLGAWDAASTDPRAYNMIATHLFGAARMGVGPREGVVGTDFQCHGAPGLYVVDSSVFPSNIGVNPQHSIMALARLAAARAVGG